MKLSEWAKEQGLHYQTAARWAREGTMPVPVTKTPTGRYLVQMDTPVSAKEGRTVGYCRVSSSDQKSDLERQEGRLAVESIKRGVHLNDIVSEVGSGLNAKRPKFTKLLSDPNVTTIVVEHSDRIARFGIDHLRAAMSASGRKIVILDGEEIPDDIIRDFSEVLTSMCARIYGRRSAQRRANAAISAAGETA